MWRDSLYLADIIEAADYIADFVAESDFRMFQDSELLRSAVAQKLAIIGEAAARLSAELKMRHPQILWPQIVAFATSYPRLLRGRLGGGVAGRQESLSRVAERGSLHPCGGIPRRRERGLIK